MIFSFNKLTPAKISEHAIFPTGRLPCESPFDRLRRLNKEIYPAIPTNRRRNGYQAQVLFRSVT